jgi:hypothetical protein
MLAFMGGCEVMPALPQRAGPIGAGGTYLIHLPGVGGDSPFDRWWMNELELGGAVSRIELYDWTRHDPWMGALTAYAQNHREALKVADLIMQRRLADQHARIVVSGESGGAAPLIWALEKLPQGAMVDDVVLVAPAISPGYDLSAALRHIRGKMYSFNSAGDWFILGWGTSTFGTMDGKKCQAAGRYGFVLPRRADAREYKKLVQIPYNPDWMKYWDFGGHTGAMSAAFARHVVAPMLRREEHTERPSSQARAAG